MPQPPPSVQPYRQFSARSVQVAGNLPPRGAKLRGRSTTDAPKLRVRAAPVTRTAERERSVPPAPSPTPDLQPCRQEAPRASPSPPRTAEDRAARGTRAALTAAAGESAEQGMRAAAVATPLSCEHLERFRANPRTARLLPSQQAARAAADRASPRGYPPEVHTVLTDSPRHRARRCAAETQYVRTCSQTTRRPYADAQLPRIAAGLGITPRRTSRWVPISASLPPPLIARGAPGGRSPRGPNSGGAERGSRRGLADALGEKSPGERGDSCSAAGGTGERTPDAERASAC